MIDKLDEKALARAVKRAMENAGTLPAKEAVKLVPADWHRICDLVLTPMTADTAPAAMPGEEDVARVLRPAVWARCDAAGVTDTSTGTGITIGDLSARRISLDDARAILALFAPILAEKEQRDAAIAKQAEFDAWLEDLAQNPPPVSDALRKLYADYQAAGIKSLVTEASWEARALAAEAALAAERERCARIAEAHDGLPCRSLLEGQRGEDYDSGQIDASTSIAAAIRAQGE